MRRLVGIDAGVLDQDLAANVGRAFTFVRFGCGVWGGEQEASGDIALQASVDVAGASDFELLETFGRGQLGDYLLGDLAGCFAETLGQFERERQSELAHLDRGRLVDDDVRQLDLVLAAQESANGAGELLLLL